MKAESSFHLDDLAQMPAIVAAVRSAFQSFARGEFDMPARAVFDGGRSLVMPVHHRPTGTTSVKVLRIDDARSPSITGVVVWSGPSGEVVFDAEALTTVRTGAASGVATDLLARADASILTIIGAGAQAFDQVAAIVAVRELSEIRVIARRRTAAETFAAQLSTANPDIAVHVATDPAGAISSTDILTCSTSSLSPVFRAADLPASVHINAIGSYRLDMREIPDDAFVGADVVVDSLEAAISEAGEIVSAVAAGTLAVADISELGQRLNDDSGPRSSRTIFKSVGVAIQDWAAASTAAALGS